MTKINYSPEAQNDLDSIWEYITYHLSNPIAADNTVNTILDAIDNLETNPQMGIPLYFSDGLNSGYRYLICNSYLAFYRYSHGDVYVDRILYGRSDYMKVLFPD